jgi:hypothetical protein
LREESELEQLPAFATRATLGSDLHYTEFLAKTNLAKRNENARRILFFIRNPKLLD